MKVQKLDLIVHSLVDNATCTHEHSTESTSDKVCHHLRLSLAIKIVQTEVVRRNGCIHLVSLNLGHFLSVLLQSVWVHFE